MKSRSYAKYAVYFFLVVVLSMGVERTLDFWNWSWNPSVVWRTWIPTGRFVLVFMAAAACLGTLHLAMIRRPVARVAIFLYLTVSLGYVFFYIIQEDRVPITHDAMVAFDGLKDMFIIGKTIFAAYPRQLLTATLAAAVIAAGILLVGKRARELPKIPVPFWFAMFCYIGAIVFFCVFPRRELQIPVFIRTPAIIVNGLKASYAIYAGPRAAPAMEAREPEKFRSHILFIMDETIIGKYLGINGFDVDTTPFLRTVKDPNFHNYGIASAAGNLSALSNIIVVSGLRSDQIPDHDQRSMRQASIFGYAKAAGRETYYIDAQNSQLMNFMFNRDLMDFSFIQLIQNNLDYERIEEHRIDFKAISMIKGMIEESTEPMFIFLLKTGCHNPYEIRYPPGASYPELDGASETRQPYYYALRWNVDEFLRHASENLAGTDTIIVYTGDHGEDLRYLEGGNMQAHGNMDNPDPIEANVPIMIWTMSERAEAEFKQAGGFRDDNINKASHYQLFPTLLALMGYDKEQAESLFGPSLFDPPPPVRRFVSGDYLDFNRTEGVRWLNSFDQPDDGPAGAGKRSGAHKNPWILK